MMKQLKLVAIGLVAAFAGFAGAQAPPARLFEIIGMNVPFEQRVGVNDDAQFVVHFGGDTHGSLDVCG